MCVVLFIGILIAIICLLLIVAAFIPIRLCIVYKSKAMKITLKYGKIKLEIPLGKSDKAKKKKAPENKKKKQKEKKDDFGRFQVFIALLQAFYDTSPSIRKTIEVEKLEADALFGGADAAFTGMAVGFAYAEIYKLIGFLATIFTVNQPVIKITPVFEDRALFELDAEGIIKTKAAHIISTAKKFYFNYKKALK